jgi:putative transposase
MPRNARIVVPGAAHHVTQRGIRRSPIFYDSEDRDSYTEVIGRNCEKFGVGILAWCWMTNHVHLVAVPEHANSLALALRRAHSIYARRFNAKYHFSGYLWQNRYYSCPLDESHTFAAIRYVEQNPVRANMVVLAEDYPWSSARAHSRGCADVLLSANWNPISAGLYGQDHPVPSPDILGNWQSNRGGVRCPSRNRTNPHKKPACVTPHMPVFD